MLRCKTAASAASRLYLSPSLHVVRAAGWRLRSPALESSTDVRRHHMRSFVCSSSLPLPSSSPSTSPLLLASAAGAAMPRHAVSHAPMSPRQSQASASAICAALPRPSRSRSLHTLSASVCWARFPIVSRFTPAIQEHVLKTTDLLKALNAQLEALPANATKESTALWQKINYLKPIVEVVERFRAKRKEIDELEALADSSTSDPDMTKLAESEIRNAIDELSGLERELLSLLVPKDLDDERNAILEIRAGTGGSEASLFAAEMFVMYQNYAKVKGWRFEVIEVSPSEVGGYKDASASISGQGVFGTLKYESGVHRVQRIPETETQGRVHTSTVTVALLPEAVDVDIEINEKDLRIETMRAGGAGGQHVQKTESAIRITHIPSGVSVHVQEDRSQHKNRAKAMQVIRARLYDIEKEKLAKERATARSEQIGSGSRSERIRTYNYPQDRITDHRIGLTVHGIEGCMMGSDLDNIIEPLQSHSEAESLSEAVRAIQATLDTKSGGGDSGKLRR